MGIGVDRERSAARIEREIETLSGPEFTTSSEAIRRYAYTPEYRRTLDHFGAALRELGFTVDEDPVGTLVARNRPPGEPAFGIGSHCDSNRNGGRYDGTMGVVTALEVCRLSAEHGLDLPLQLVSFLEEEGSGFGQMLLGSRIMLQRVTEDDLRERFRAVDDGRSFWEHAEAAGYEPARWRESIHVLDGLTGWIEMHIEQARVLQDTREADRDRRRDRGLRPRRRLRHRPRRPRRRDADGPSARPDDRPRGDGAGARAPRDRGGRRHGRHRRRDRARPEPDQCRRRGGALLARRARPAGRALPGRRAGHGGLRRAGSGAARHDRPHRAAPDASRDPARRRARRRAGGGRRRDGRAVDDDALGRRARHDVRRRARAERHGLRPVHRRDQPSPGRGGRPGRRRARGRDHPERDRRACGSDGAWTPSCSACWPARSSAR